MRDAAAVFDDFHRLEDFEEAAFSAEAANAGLIEQLHERLGGAIEDGNLDVININEDVVDAIGIGGGEQVFGGGEKDALPHQAGGVTDARDVLAVRLDRKVVEVNAAKHDTGVWRSGEEAEVCVDPGMETYPLGFNGTADGALEHMEYLTRGAHCKPNKFLFVL